MATTLDQVKRKIAEYLSQKKPEPYLVMQFSESVTLETIDWLKSVGAEWRRNFWVLSRDKAKQALFPPQIDWAAHWKDEEARMAKRIKGAFGDSNN